MIAGCAQKVPSPSSDLNALLVIPHEGGIKKGKHGFGFHYTFSLIDEVGTEYFIGFSPSSPSRDKKLIIIETLPPGKYRFQYRNDCLRIRAQTKSNCKKRKTKEIKFELKKNSVTILKHIFTVLQGPHPVKKNAILITAEFKKLEQDSNNEFFNKFKLLENSDKWEILTWSKT